ncbi:MAG: GNAT family N-acetyltransferase [Negativicutes bacterium]|nr:GNAT family N-acetyltransferase [Negativicutes bacterium]
MSSLLPDKSGCEQQPDGIRQKPAPGVRRYRASDWPYLTAIYDAARRDELLRCGLGKGFVPLANCFETEKLFADEVWVITEANQPVGFAATAEQELTWLYIQPLHYRQGLARILLLWIVNRTKRPLRVCVLAGNYPAIALYESFQFQFRREVRGMLPSNPPLPAVGLIYELF